MAWARRHRGPRGQPRPARARLRPFVRRSALRPHRLCAPTRAQAGRDRRRVSARRQDGRSPAPVGARRPSAATGCVPGCTCAAAAPASSARARTPLCDAAPTGQLHDDALGAADALLAALGRLPIDVREHRRRRERRGDRARAASRAARRRAAATTCACRSTTLPGATGVTAHRARAARSSSPVSRPSPTRPAQLVPRALADRRRCRRGRATRVILPGQPLPGRRARRARARRAAGATVRGPVRRRRSVRGRAGGSRHAA